MVKSKIDNVKFSFAHLHDYLFRKISLAYLLNLIIFPQQDIQTKH